MSKRGLFEDEDWITFNELGGNPEVKEGKVNIKDIVGEVYGGLGVGLDEELPIPEEENVTKSRRHKKAKNRVRKL
jgi:hypothetical protein